MIVRDGMNPQVEKWKKELGIRGDVYIFDHKIASLETHRKLFPQSTANTIEEAQLERKLFEEAEAKRRAEEEKNRPVEEEEPAPKGKKGK